MAKSKTEISKHADPEMVEVAANFLKSKAVKTGDTSYTVAKSDMSTFLEEQGISSTIINKHMSVRDALMVASVGFLKDNAIEAIENTKNNEGNPDNIVSSIMINSPDNKIEVQLPVHRVHHNPKAVTDEPIHRFGQARIRISTKAMLKTDEMKSILTSVESDIKAALGL